MAMPPPSVVTVATTWPDAEPTWTLNVKPGVVTPWPVVSVLTICSSPVGAAVGGGEGVGAGVAAGGSATETVATAFATTATHWAGVYCGATWKPGGAALSTTQ